MRISDWSSDVCSSDLKLVLAQRIADERGHHGNRRFHIACGAQRPERLHRKLGPAFRHIKPAVAGKARQGHFFETERGRTAAGAAVSHGAALSPWRRTLNQNIDPAPYRKHGAAGTSGTDTV